MQFRILQEFTKSIINTMQNTVVEAVRNLKSHTFTVKVSNPPPLPPKTIKVSNQAEVTKEIKKTTVEVNLLRKLVSKWQFPREIKISNFPAFPKFPEFPKQINVGNFPKFPAFPTEIKISNPVDLSDLSTEIGTVRKAVENLKLDPKINVSTPAPEHIVVPAPQVSVTQTEIDYEKLAKEVAKVTPTINYEKLAEALSKEMASMVITSGGGGGNSNSFRGRDGKPGRALVDEKGRVITSPDYYIADKATQSGVTITGNQDSEGNWYMMKVDGDAIRYASNTNNPDLTYPDAWAARNSLVYTYPAEVSF